MVCQLQCSRERGLKKKEKKKCFTLYTYPNPPCPISWEKLSVAFTIMAKSIGADSWSASIRFSLSLGIIISSTKNLQKISYKDVRTYAIKTYRVVYIYRWSFFCSKKKKKEFLSSFFTYQLMMQRWWLFLFLFLSSFSSSSSKIMLKEPKPPRYKHKYLRSILFCFSSSLE